MPFTVFDGFNLFDKLKVIVEKTVILPWSSLLTVTTPMADTFFGGMRVYGLIIDLDPYVVNSQEIFSIWSVHIPT